jgi:hypothetical protein
VKCKSKPYFPDIFVPTKKYSVKINQKQALLFLYGEKRAFFGSWPRVGLKETSTTGSQKIANKGNYSG